MKYGWKWISLMISKQTCILAIADAHTGTDVGPTSQLGLAMSTFNINCNKPWSNLEKLWRELPTISNQNCCMHLWNVEVISHLSKLWWGWNRQHFNCKIWDKSMHTRMNVRWLHLHIAPAFYKGNAKKNLQASLYCKWNTWATKKWTIWAINWFCNKEVGFLNIWLLCILYN